MRICILSERLAPPFDEGFKNVALHLLTELSAHHEVLGLTCFGQDMPDQGIANIMTNRLFLSREMRRTIRQFQPNIVYYIPTASVTLSSFARARVLRLYAKKSRIALVALQPRYNSAFAKWLIRRLVSSRPLSPDLILALSRPIIASLPSLPCPTATIPAGVDLERFKPCTLAEKAELRRKYGLPERSWILLHVGHVKRERNLQIMPHIAAKCQVVVVASSSTTKEMDLARELKQAGVFLIPGYLPIEDAYHLADGYLFPVTCDTAAIGMPLSVLEAMACNLPVVSTPFGGLPEHFAANPDGGFWYAATDEDLIARVEDMVHAFPDGGQSARANTRAMVASYGWPQVSERILATTLRAIEAAR